MLQMFRAKLFLVIAACLVVVACADTTTEPTLDLSNENAFETSIQEVMASLDEEQQGDFSDALSMIMFDELANGTAAGMSEEEIERSIYQRLHGKTGADVLEDMTDNL